MLLKFPEEEFHLKCVGSLPLILSILYGVKPALCGSCVSFGNIGVDIQIYISCCIYLLCCNKSSWMFLCLLFLDMKLLIKFQRFYTYIFSCYYNAQKSPKYSSSRFGIPCHIGFPWSLQLAFETHITPACRIATKRLQDLKTCKSNILLSNIWQLYGAK